MAAPGDRFSSLSKSAPDRSTSVPAPATTRLPNPAPARLTAAPACGSVRLAVPKLADLRSALVVWSDTASADKAWAQWIEPAEIDTFPSLLPTRSVSIAAAPAGAVLLTSSALAPTSSVRLPFHAATSSRSPAGAAVAELVRTTIEALPLALKASTPAPRSTNSDPPTAVGLNEPVTAPSGRRIGRGTAPAVTEAAPVAMTSKRSLPEVP